MAEVALRDYVHEIDGMIEHSAYDAAIQHSHHILQHFPKYVEAYRVLGKALLEKGDDAAAADIFQRVLSVDPEDFVARVGLSIIHDRRDQFEAAIWHMERAFDLMPSNEIIQSELRRLYARRDGVEPERVSLTRSALARMYAHGDLYAEAITSLRQLLQAQPDRIDLQVLMAEVLWRDDQRIEASDLAQRIIANLPHCLKANLIYGNILREGGSTGESEDPLRRAQAVDPDNYQAARLFGNDSPLPPQRTSLMRMEQPSYVELLEGQGAAAEPEEVPDWLRGLAEINTATSMIEPPESAVNPPLPTGLHMPGTEPLRSEIPDWLQGLTTPVAEPAQPAAEVPSWLTQLGTASMEPTPESATAMPAADWLNQLQATTPPVPATMKDEEVPEWIKQLGTGELRASELPVVEPTAEETPDWLSQLGGFGQLDRAANVEAPSMIEKTSDQLQAPGVMPSESTALPTPADETLEWPREVSSGTNDSTAEIPEAIAPTEETITPDWLAQLRTETPAVTEAPPEAGTSDWLAQLSATPTESIATPTPADEMPDWLRQVGAASIEPTAETTEAITPTEETITPDWLAQLQAAVPPSDEVLKPEASEAEPATRFEEDADRETIDRLGEAFQPESTAEPVAPEPEALSAIGGPSAEIEPTAAFSLEPEAAADALPSADDALAFLSRLAAGKEDQLRAEAEQEGEARMAAIMGRKPVEAKPPHEEGVSIGDVVKPVAEAGAGLIGLAGKAVSGVAGLVTRHDEAPIQTAQPETVAAEATPSGEASEAAVEPLAAEVAPSLEVSEALPSAHEALAFLSRLAAGKEDQLRAEAEQEGEARMAAIMGRKPIEPIVEATPIEAAPIEKATFESEVKPEAIAPVAEVEPLAAEIAPALEVSEAMPSADEALAFLSRLAAGKEDQLRAEAEQEGEARMAAIIGRKPEVPVVEAAPLEAMAEPDVLSTEPAIAEAAPDWLAQLTAAAAALPAEPTPESDMPDWLRALQPMALTDESSVVEATETTVPVEPTPEAELPDWLRDIQPMPETRLEIEPEIEAAPVEIPAEPVQAAPSFELPDWLRDLQPAASAATIAPADEVPDWLRAMRPESIEIVDEAEVAAPALEETTHISAVTAPVEEMLEVEVPQPESEAVALVTEPPQTADILESIEPIVAAPTLDTTIAETQSTPVGSMDWWTQVAEDENEPTLTELPPIVKAPMVAVRTEAAPARTLRERGPQRRPERPWRELRSHEARERETRPATPPAIVASVDVDPLMAQLEADKYNHAVRLELARAWWSMGNRDSALEEYGKLINPATVEDFEDEDLEERDFADAGPLADDIIADLERIIDIDDHPGWPRLLGDMHMKVGDLSRALEMYRRALNQL